MNEFTKDSLSKEIFHKIKLFTNENYFKLFAYILTKKSKNFAAFEKISSLTLSIDNFQNERDIKKFKKLYKTKNEEKKDKFSYWFYLMIYICNIKSKKKILKLGKNELGIDPMIYAYMINYCQNKVKLLHNLSIHHNLNLNNLVKFYLELCSYNILLNKEIKSKNEEYNIINNFINNNFSRRKTRINYNINLKQQKNYQIAKKNAKLRLSTYLENKSFPKKKKINYSNSFTRLFIGETDQKSVEERHISNIFIKNFCDLKLFNKKTDVASLYLKKLYNKLSKKKEIIIDSGLNNVLNKFKLDSKMVETYQKNSLSSDKKENISKKQFNNNINVYNKTFLENKKFSTFEKISKFSAGTPKAEYLMNLKNSRDKLNLNIKKNLSRNLDFYFSSDFNRGFSQQYSRNISNNIKSFRMSVTNNNKNNSTINTRLSNNKNNNIKINLKYSSVSGFRLRNKRNNSDILINIKTKLNKENYHHFNINPKKYQIKSSLSNELSFE